MFPKNHLPWGVSSSGATGFATSEETPYPPRLAMSIALCVARVLPSAGWTTPAVSLQANDRTHEMLMTRAIAGIQPKASRIPPLVPEHREVLVVCAERPMSPPCANMTRLDRPWPVPHFARCPVRQIPAKSQLLRYTPLAANKGENSSLFEIAWGVPWEETEFVAEAARIGHPRSLPSVVPDPLGGVLEQLAKMTDAEVCEARARKLKEWLSLATSLEDNERDLKKTLHPQVRSIVEPKRILLWEAMMRSAGYNDISVADLFKQGVPLTGRAPISGMFKAKLRPMGVTDEWAKKNACEIRRSVLRAIRPQGEIDATVLEKTLLERDSGWLSGPLPESA